MAIADHGVEALVSTGEQKAIDTAAILGATLGHRPQDRAGCARSCRVAAAHRPAALADQP
jgi:hypothetical protein